jgi:hypothetical protein
MISGSGAMPPAPAASGSGGIEPSFGRVTVVKQMLYSCGRRVD